MYPVEEVRTWNGSKPWFLHSSINSGMISDLVWLEPITSTAVTRKVRIVLVMGSTKDAAHRKSLVASLCRFKSESPWVAHAVLTYMNEGSRIFRDV